MLNTKWNRKKIETHEFEVDLQGYDPEEVDNVLDEIVSDYEMMEKMIQDCESRISELSMKNNEMSSQIINLTAQNSNLNKEVQIFRNDGYNNLLYTKRISSLEKKVDEFTNSVSKMESIEKTLEDIRNHVILGKQS